MLSFKRLAPLLVLLAGNANAANVISISPDPIIITAGSTFTADLNVNFDDPTSGGVFSIVYDTDILDFVDFTFDSAFEALVPSLQEGQGNDTTGVIENIRFQNNFATLSQDLGLSGLTKMATLTFSVVKEEAGIFQIASNVIPSPYSYTLGEHSINDTSFDNGFFPTAADRLQVTLQGSYQPAGATPIPLPGALGFMILGLAGLAGWRIRQSS